MSNINIIELQNKINKCKNIQLNEVDKNKIVEISEIKISRRKSSNDKILDFLIYSDNPYIFKVNNTLVKIEFSTNEQTAERCISTVLKSLYK